MSLPQYQFLPPTVSRTEARRARTRAAKRLPAAKNSQADGSEMQAVVIATTTSTASIQTHAASIIRRFIEDPSINKQNAIHTVQEYLDPLPSPHYHPILDCVDTQLDRLPTCSSILRSAVTTLRSRYERLRDQKIQELEGMWNGHDYIPSKFRPPILSQDLIQQFLMYCKEVDRRNIALSRIWEEDETEDAADQEGVSLCSRIRQLPHKGRKFLTVGIMKQARKRFGDGGQDDNDSDHNKDEDEELPHSEVTTRDGGSPEIEMGLKAPPPLSEKSSKFSNFGGGWEGDASTADREDTNDDCDLLEDPQSTISPDQRPSKRQRSGSQHIPIPESPSVMKRSNMLKRRRVGSVPVGHVVNAEEGNTTIRLRDMVRKGRASSSPPMAKHGPPAPFVQVEDVSASPCPPRPPPHEPLHRSPPSAPPPPATPPPPSDHPLSTTSLRRAQSSSRPAEGDVEELPDGHAASVGREIPFSALRQALHSLQPGARLNDFALNTLIKRLEKERSNICTIDSLVFENYISRKGDALPTRILRGMDNIQDKQILIPMFDRKRHHWTLLHGLGPPSFRIHHYDSLSCPLSAQQEARMVTFFKQIYSMTALDGLRIEPQKCQQQANNIDCGIFTLAAARNLVQGLHDRPSIPYNIKRLRVEYAAELRTSPYAGPACFFQPIQSRPSLAPQHTFEETTTSEEASELSRWMRTMNAQCIKRDAYAVLLRTLHASHQACFTRLDQLDSDVAALLAESSTLRSELYASLQDSIAQQSRLVGLAMKSSDKLITLQECLQGGAANIEKHRACDVALRQRQSNIEEDAYDCLVRMKGLVVLCRVFGAQFNVEKGRYKNMKEVHEGFFRTIKDFG